MKAAADDEMVIGIVARMGVDLAGVIAELATLLKDYGYESVEVRVTDSLRELENYKNLPIKPLEKRYQSYINACNEFRGSTKLKDVMARLAVARINLVRSGDPSGPGRTAYIINQLKRTEETDLLRSIYGEHYIQVSCHASEDYRTDRLADQIAGDHPDKPRSTTWKSTAQDLVRIDEAQEDVENGQRVRDVFPLSDVVIDASSSARAKEHLDRFLRAIFGDHTVTPTREEYGMHLANTASLRSSDLSRQVGAAILNKAGEIQALGSNEVAKAGGGTYWEGDPGDARDFRLGKDSNDERKREFLMDLALRMQKAGLFEKSLSTPESIRAALLEREDDLIKNSQIMDSLEYGRSVHAEMNAITDAARVGHVIRDCVLHTNTFPCHNCAKHIVAAGISEVIYLRPYPKSFAGDLFKDSICIDADVSSGGRINFRQFIGIVGPIYDRVFSKRRVKGEDGLVPPFDRARAVLTQRTPLPLIAYEAKEADTIAGLASALQEAGLEPVGQ